MKKIRILSIDGGGIRGLMPAVILDYIETRIKEKLIATLMKGPEGLSPGTLEQIDEELRLSDFFDLIAGTSTGGILTCLYLCPQKQYQGRPFPASLIKDFYSENGEQIFPKTIFHTFLSGFGLTEEKYDQKPLEEIARQKFGKKTLADLVKPCLVTAYDITDRKAVLFTSAESKENKNKNFRLTDVVRSTSAAPTYFEPAQIYNTIGASFELIDGGLYANNPSLCAYSEARKMRFSTYSKEKPDFPTAKDMLLISLGTGSVKKQYDFEKMKNAGAIGWAKPIIDILMSSNSETISYFLKQIYDTLKSKEEKGDYYRFEPTIHLSDPEMDNCSPENLENLTSDALDFISKNVSELDEVVDKLIVNGEEFEGYVDRFG